MHTCLSFAASQKDEVAITHLLRVAKFDPKHVDIIKEIKRSKNLVFYDGVSLLVLCLYGWILAAF